MNIPFAGRVPFRPSAVALAALTSLSLAAPAAWAQQAAAEAPAKAESQELSTVIVTAQKRTQTLKEVPVAISVISADQLQKQGVSDITDLSKAVAALEFGDTKTGGPGGSASIRGIGTAVFTTSAESSVGVVVDGVPLGNTAGGALFDLERVEVLRGPQGTLFGKNASAGVLNMVTKAPRFKLFEGAASLELSGKNVLGSKLGNTVLRGAFNVPINDISALRVTAHADRLSGVYNNVYNGTDAKTVGTGLRLRYLLKPDADLSVNLIADYDRNKSTNAVFFAPAIAYAKNTAGNHSPLAEFAACGVTVSLKNNDVCSDSLELWQATVGGLSAQIDKTLASGMTLTSITAVRERKTGPDTAAIDMSVGYDKVRTVGTEVNIRQMTQELRLSSASGQAVDWVAGLFLSDYHSTKASTTTILPSPYAPSPPVPRSISTLINYTTDSGTAALFGQATFKLGEQLKLLTGLRYTRDRVKDVQVRTANVAFASFAAPTTVKSGAAEARNNDLSGKLGLLYALDKQTQGYFTLSRGYKAPQIDNDTPISALAASGSTSGTLVKAEQPTSLELGLKTSLFNRRLDVDVAVFNTSLKNFQEQNCTLSPVGALNCIPLSVPEVKSYGLELDMRARVLGALSLRASGALILGTEYPSGFVFDNQNVGNQRLLYSPKGKLTVGADYDTEVWGGYGLNLGLDATYKSAVRLCNTLAPECSFKAHTIVGLHGGVRSPDDRWGINLFVRNAADERVPNAILYPLPGKGAGSGYAYSLGANSFRTVGMTADIKF
ncbi:TonB-dependent receptor [Aquabacterium sp. OR-4]|uniref:TonB-dependent receptor n=1 Tax=Aquabacterium sp. OR-4 TaxID=2978127 RepID=UPI0021B4ADC6|nr:TonB-dependent receptor [Aquabacterium sp. OR-4]MDT7837922.1 TonB-dependent receptor [Aquabacterium sp. OR-4]